MTLDFILATWLFDRARETTNLCSQDMIEEHRCSTCNSSRLVPVLQHTLQVKPLQLQSLQLDHDALITLVQQTLLYQNDSLSNCVNCGPTYLHISRSFSTPPSTLIIHISRAVYLAGGREIYDDTLIEPLTFLPLQPSLFQLVAVAWHIPDPLNRSIRAGHYVATTLINGDCFLHDDDMVRKPLPDCKVDFAYAYCLFYVKLN